MNELAVRWLFPGDGPPLENVALRAARGTIVSLRPTQRPARAVALLPALLNAHTHLEFSSLRSPIEPLRDFARWLPAVIAERSQRTEPPQVAIAAGLEESWRAGVAGLAEISTEDHDWGALRSPACPRLMVFREVLGLRTADIPEKLRIAERFLAARTIPGLTRGLSPHASYSVHPDLLRGLCQLAAAADVPVAMHLGESPAERELLEHRSGPIVEFLRERGLWNDQMFPPGWSFAECLNELARAPRGLIVHASELQTDEVRVLQMHPQLSVVYCPRTHAAMQTSVPPWPRLSQQGVNVALGTDSRASNPDLSIWNELHALRLKHPGYPASELLALATVNAARALGWADLGRLQPRCAARGLLVELSPLECDDPERLQFTGAPRPVSW